MSTSESNLLTLIPGVRYLTYEQMNILINYQSLWANLALWIRSVMRSTAFNNPDLQTNVNQLFYKVPQDFYETFQLFYGREIAQYFINYLTRFIASALQLINAYRDNNVEAINTSTSQWYQSADDLAAFLASINIYWDTNQWRSLFYQYIRFEIEEIIAFQGGDYEQEIAIFRSKQELSNLMGSYMARGIIAKNAGLNGATPPATFRFRLA